MHRKRTLTVPLVAFSLYACAVALAAASQDANVDAHGRGEKREERAPFVEVAPSAVDSAAQGMPPEVEPNGNPATATPIGPDEVVLGNIFPTGDVDYWSFVGNVGDRVYATVQAGGSAGGFGDSELRLIAPGGVTVVEFDQDDASGLSSSIGGAVLPVGGTYTLQVKNGPFGVTTTIRPYQLHFRLQSGTPAAEVEPNDTPSQLSRFPPAAGSAGRGARTPTSTSSASRPVPATPCSCPSTWTRSATASPGTAGWAWDSSATPGTASW